MEAENGEEKGIQRMRLLVTSIMDKNWGRGRRHQVETGFLRQVSVGNQAGQQIDHEIGRTAMASMLDLRDILELVNDGLDDRPFTQQHLVLHLDQPVLHILA